jgi:hypothetical protein
MDKKAVALSADLICCLRVWAATSGVVGSMIGQAVYQKNRRYGCELARTKTLLLDHR